MSYPFTIEITSRFFGDDPLDFLEVLARVHADRRLLDEDYADPDAALKRPQLLKGLGDFKRRLFPFGEAQQEVPAVSVEAEVLKIFLPAAVPVKRDGRAREVERVVLLVRDHFDEIWRARLPLADGSAGRRHEQAAVLEHRL